MALSRGNLKTDGLGRGEAHSGRKALAAHVVPFLLWIFFILGFVVCDKLGSPLPRSWSAPAYALKSVLCAALLLYFRPWKYYRRQPSTLNLTEGGRGQAIGNRNLNPQPLNLKKGSGVRQWAIVAEEPQPSTLKKGSGVRQWAIVAEEPQTSNLKPQTSYFAIVGILAGLFVAVLWIFPEMPWTFAHAKSFAVFYNKWLIMPLGAYPDYFRSEFFPALPPLHPSLAYSPQECGWTMTVAKLLGSAFVIAAAEELFFRGFLYRWLRKSDFLSIPLVRYDAQIFWAVVVVFGLEHDRWLAGMVAGAVYGWLVLRTGRLMPSVVAHAVTNLVLGLYVIVSHQYGFW